KMQQNSADKGEGSPQPLAARLAARARLVEGSVFRWAMVGPAGLVARWRSEHAAIVEGFMVFSKTAAFGRVTRAFCLSSVVDLRLDDASAQEDDASAAGLRLRLVVGGRKELVLLRLADAAEGKRWLAALEEARSSPRGGHDNVLGPGFVPVRSLWKMMKDHRQEFVAWTELNQSTGRLGGEGHGLAAVALRGVLRRVASNCLHPCLHKMCRQSDARGRSFIASSLAALHLGHGLRHLLQRRLSGTFRHLAARPLAAEVLGRWVRRREARQLLRLAMAAWRQTASEVPESQAPLEKGIDNKAKAAEKAPVPLRGRRTSEVRLARRVWRVWRRVAAAAEVERTE
ncbi:unnamed protein product, partial [Polarella glacialis]